MNDFELGVNTHDLVVQNGTINLLNREDKVARQSLTINLLTYRGEWFLDLAEGIPYFQQILIKGVTQSFVDSIIKQAIRTSPFITSIRSFRSEMTTDSYILREFTGITTNGEIVSITNQTLV
jgi:hypothetical protein